MQAEPGETTDRRSGTRRDDVQERAQHEARRESDRCERDAHDENLCGGLGWA